LVVDWSACLVLRWWFVIKDFRLGLSEEGMEEAYEKIQHDRDRYSFTGGPGSGSYTQDHQISGPYKRAVPMRKATRS
jgi:hypothetical protein